MLFREGTRLLFFICKIISKIFLKNYGQGEMDVLR